MTHPSILANISPAVVTAEMLDFTLSKKNLWTGIYSCSQNQPRICISQPFPKLFFALSLHRQ